MEENNGKKPSNPLALAGFIVSLCSLLVNFAGLVGLVATVLSAFGLSKVKTTGTGKGFAIAGLIIGIISIVWGIIAIVLVSSVTNNVLQSMY